MYIWFQYMSFHFVSLESDKSPSHDHSRFDSHVIKQIINQSIVRLYQHININYIISWMRYQNIVDISTNELQHILLDRLKSNILNIIIFNHIRHISYASSTTTTLCIWFMIKQGVTNYYTTWRRIDQLLPNWIELLKYAYSVYICMLKWYWILIICNMTKYNVCQHLISYKNVMSGANRMH